MIRIQFHGETFTPSRHTTEGNRPDRLLDTLQACLTLAQTPPDMRQWMRDCSFLTWNMPYTFAERTGFQPVMEGHDETDWQWLKHHPATLNLTSCPWDTPADMARALATKADIGQAGCRALATAECAHAARHHPDEWALAILQTTPRDYRPDAHPPLSANPLLGIESWFAAPGSLDGEGGPGTAFALADCARIGLWRVPQVTRPDGRIWPISEHVWDTLDSMGLRHVFDYEDF